MEQTVITDHDHLDWNDVRQCDSVRELSRWTLCDNGDFESVETMLSRAGEVAEGMKAVMQQVCKDSTRVES